MGKKKNLQSKYLRIHEWLKQHWLVYSFCIFIPTIWASLVLKYWGVALLLVDANQSFTPLGKVVTIIIYLASFILFAYNNHYALRNDLEINGLKSSLRLYGFIIKSIHFVCRNKYDTLVTRMEEFDLQHTNLPSIVSDPTKQITSLINELLRCTSNVTEIDERHIAVALAMDDELTQVKDRWEWFRASRGIEGGKSVNDLINSKESSLYHVYQREEDYLFENDKRAAMNAKRYIPDSKDDRNLIGSIVCKNITIRPEAKCFRSILTISTYGQKFVYDDNLTSIDTVKRNIEEMLLYEFEQRFQIELVLYWLFIKGQSQNLASEK